MRAGHVENRFKERRGEINSCENRQRNRERSIGRNISDMEIVEDSLPHLNRKRNIVEVGRSAVKADPGK